MRKTFILLLLLSVSTAFAQRNYKQLLQHLSECTEREALYVMEDYRRLHPQEANPYYVLGNYYYQLQGKEHVLVDYADKMLCLYNAKLYYGNCKVYILQDDIKPDWYPETAIGGKVTDGTIMKYLNAQIEACTELEEKATALYNAYHQLVMDYNSCFQDFRTFSTQYSRLKEAQMLFVEEQDTILSHLKELSARLPEDIKNYRAALEACPIDNYSPSFHFRPIEYFRLDGLTETDFLQNDVELWDYQSWLDAFYLTQKEIKVLRSDVDKEQLRLTSALTATEKPAADRKQMAVHKLLLNRINKYDEGSAIAAFLKLEQQVVEVQSLAARISTENLDENEWVTTMQLAYRLHKMVEEVRMAVPKLAKDLAKSSVGDKYPAFVDKYSPKTQVDILQSMAAKTEADLEQLLLQAAALNPALPSQVQISEELVADLTDHLAFY